MRGEHVYILPAVRIPREAARPRPVGGDPSTVPPGRAALRSDVIWAALLAFSVALVVAMLVLARPLGHLLLSTHGVHFFPSELPEVYPKPTQEMRYVLAVLFAAGLALLVARGRIPAVIATHRMARNSLRLAAIVGRLGLLALVVWAWQSQFRGLSGQFPNAHFNDDDLLVAILIAALLTHAVQLRPRWLEMRAIRGVRSPWLVFAAALTACWLLPDVYRAQNLAPALFEVTYHLEFTFDDFVAHLNGLTPLVNYNAQYASLLPFAVGPLLAIVGVTVGAFTVIMCVLTWGSLLAVERVLANVARNELVGFVLYVPLLAVSLYTLVPDGAERYDFADYFAVFPLRYFGPYVLLWLCIRHLRGLRPHKGATLFLCAGLVLLNNLEFGLPAFVATAAACVAASKAGQRMLRRLGRSLILGLIAALVLVSLLTLLEAGQLPDLGSLTRYSRLFAVAGYTMLPTSLDGFQLIMFVTFAGALVAAGLRYRRRAGDRALTGALTYSGVFGLGAGAYFMGRSHPNVLVTLFSAWALSGALLSLLALKELAREPVPQFGTLTRKHMRTWAGSTALIAATLCLAATAITQIPAPWTQFKRIATSTPAPAPYNLSPAVNFVRSTSRHDEAVMLLAPLGHEVARAAGVRNVSPFSSSADIITYELLGEMLEILHKNHGTRFFLGEYIAPEIPRVLSADGFKPVVGPGSGLTEWVR